VRWDGGWRQQDGGAEVEGDAERSNAERDAEGRAGEGAIRERSAGEVDGEVVSGRRGGSEQRVGEELVKSGGDRERR